MVESARDAMTDAAETRTPTASESRRARTRREITEYARRLTARSGLQGFTVEDLCEHAGISRRTFFNYFPGKEQAVIGEHSDSVDEDAVATFLAGRPEGTVGISPTLLDDLLAFAIAHFQTIGLTPEEASAFFAAAHREPRLIEQLMRRGEEHHRYMTMLVGTREGLVAEHPVPHMAVTLVDALVHSAVRQFFAEGNTRTLPEILQARLDVAKEIFSASASS
ncbi:TetR/AcrR family transcriptional regulator [Salinibacterium sp. SYSU T00001]|uniref:TetR/AcrR family transcriptional regulator n=1 Tax=Homoserinimonas sedimenticola TaxID=2986805 RepID=UPI0022363155|nr:TetR/AcrR family transcriptional regulator [Salinibacterium sedimenticola]MCW4386287.1 TetR/AcrR family transcriptional regulator [Salinibacterium sedimenticola]